MAINKSHIKGLSEVIDNLTGNPEDINVIKEGFTIPPKIILWCPSGCEGIFEKLLTNQSMADAAIITKEIVMSAIKNHIHDDMEAALRSPYQRRDTQWLRSRVGQTLQFKISFNGEENPLGKVLEGILQFNDLFQAYSFPFVGSFVPCDLCLIAENPLYETNTTEQQSGLDESL